ncbi:MAG TPA: MTH865 family protein [Candidatus Bathyarchaeia archaeon]|nr:MTH865 family protein [Candidatus Bathyarchaeia archaeon]
MNVKEEIRSQIIGALSGATFPIHTPEELQNAMPAGGDTCCEAGDVQVTAEEAGYLLEYEDYPLGSAEEAADTIVERAGL